MIILFMNLNLVKNKIVSKATVNKLIKNLIIFIKVNYLLQKVKMTQKNGKSRNQITYLNQLMFGDDVDRALQKDRW